MGTTLPALPAVAESTLKYFLNVVAGNPEVGEQSPLPKIVEVKGRCVKIHHVDARGFGVLDREEQAEMLIGGAGKPCEEFRIDGNYIIARLKTAAQIAADDAAFDLDEAHGALDTYHVDYEAKPAATRTERVKKRKRPTDHNPKLVLKALEKDFVGESPTVDDLYDAVGEDIEAPRAGRRKEYLDKTIAKLVSSRWVSLDADDRVTLLEAQA